VHATNTLLPPHPYSFSGWPKEIAASESAARLVPQLPRVL